METVAHVRLAPDGNWIAHRLDQHVDAVGRLASGFGSRFGAAEWAHLAGLWHDRSVVRDEMSTRGLYVFKHECELGDAPARRLLDMIGVKQADPDTSARGFADFTITAPPAGRLAEIPRVTLERVIG